jgi:hypothetical protein
MPAVLVLTPSMGFAPVSTVEHVNLTDTGVTAHLTVDTPAGAFNLAVDDRSRLVVGSVLRIGAGALAEFVTIVAMPGGDAGVTGPGLISLAHGLHRSRAAGIELVWQAPTIVHISTEHLVPGMTVTGTNVPAATKIDSVTSPTTLVLSNAVTGPGIASGAPLTFTLPAVTTAPSAGGTKLTLPTTHLFPGMRVTGDNIPADTTVKSITSDSDLEISNAVTGTGVASGATITFVSNANTTAATLTPSAIVQVPTADLTAGMTVTGTNVPAATKIDSVTSPTTLVLSNAVTGPGIASGATLTFTLTVVTTAPSAGGTKLTLPTTHLFPSMRVTGDNIPPDTTVKSITSDSDLEISNAVTGTGVTSGATITFASTAITTAATPHASATVPVTTNARSGLLLLDVDASERDLIVSEVDGFNGSVRITTPDGTPYLAAIDSVSQSTPSTVQLKAALQRNQPAGATLIRRSELLEVEAIDTGEWGNRLLVAVEDESTGLVSGAAATGTIAADRIRLSSLVGVEKGTILELREPDGSRIGGLLKVADIHSNDGSATLVGALDPDQLAAVSVPNARVPIYSREFRLTVLLRQRDDPAVPSRGEQMADTEVFPICRWIRGIAVTLRPL